MTGTVAHVPGFGTGISAVTPALRRHERTSDAPALQYGQTGRAPKQYPSP